MNITQSLKLQQRRKSNTNYRHPEGIIHKLQPTDQPAKQPERQPLSYAQHENLAIAQKSAFVVFLTARFGVRNRNKAVYKN